jgi:hypothetical protein
MTPPAAGEACHGRLHGVRGPWKGLSQYFARQSKLSIGNSAINWIERPMDNLQITEGRSILHYGCPAFLTVFAAP